MRQRNVLYAMLKCEQESNTSQTQIIKLIAELRDVKKHESGELSKIYRQLINVENAINRPQKD